MNAKTGNLCIIGSNGLLVGFNGGLSWAVGWAGPKVLGPKPTVGWARAGGFGPLVGFEDVYLSPAL